MSGVNPAYDDLPEIRYHFPRTYLNKARECVGDWILYYEPRQNRGRMCYYATAKVDRIEPDPQRPDHFYAFVTDYLEFPSVVPYRDGNLFRESALRKPDGSVNKGLLGRAVHHLPENEYDAIVRLGMEPVVVADGVPRSTEPPADVVRQTLLISRPYRERAFTQVVRRAYNDTCLFTGIHLMNGGGSCEVEAAHIKSVEDYGPDSIRNGLALSRTVHWLFDHGVLSLKDDGRILTAGSLLPAAIRMMLRPDGYVRFPKDPVMRPHAQFLRHHREHRFRG
jgi:putative restriction endonuclease